MTTPASLTPTDAPIAPTIQPLTANFVVRRAAAHELPDILAIYNQSISGKQATANLSPVSLEERAAWFTDHLNNPNRPIYVVMTNPLIADAHTDTHAEPVMVAWGSFSDLYARTAYHISCEVSIYLHYDYHGQGIGRALIDWMLAQAPSLGVRNVVALIFAHNTPSLGLFTKLGFSQWGYMPHVCDMDGFTADVVMLGKALTPDQ